MSGNPLKAVTKVFKKIAKSVVGKILITVAVGYLTAGIGSALIGSLAPSLSGTLLGSVLGGAISGTVAGGITSAITGGSIGQGMLLGAVGGAIGGGIKFGMTSPTTGASTLGSTPNEIGPGTGDLMGGTGTTQAGAVGAAPDLNVTAGAPGGEVAGTMSGIPGDAVVAYNAPQAVGPAVTAPPAAAQASPGFFKSVESWAQAHPLSTEVIGGVAKGGISMLAGDSQADAYEDRNKIYEQQANNEQANTQWQRDSYNGATSGLLPASALAARPAPEGASTPGQTYAYPTVANGGRLQWNPATGRLETIAA